MHLDRFHKHNRQDTEVSVRNILGQKFGSKGSEQIREIVEESNKFKRDKTSSVSPYRHEMPSEIHEHRMSEYLQDSIASPEDNQRKLYMNNVIIRQELSRSRSHSSNQRNVDSGKILPLRTKSPYRESPEYRHLIGSGGSRADSLSSAELRQHERNLAMVTKGNYLLPL